MRSDQAIRTLAQNEFESDRYDYLIDGVRAGDTYLQQFSFQTDAGYKWAGIGYMLFFYFFANALAVVALTRNSHRQRGRGKPPTTANPGMT